MKAAIDVTASVSQALRGIMSFALFMSIQVLVTCGNAIRSFTNSWVALEVSQVW